MPMKLIRRPYAKRRIHPLVMGEVSNAYKILGAAAIVTLNEDVEDWIEKPEFKLVVTVTKKLWTMVIKYDRRTRGGKRYTWVDRGTGSYNPDTSTGAYIISPKEPGGFLAYSLPSLTKTMPASGIPSKSSQAAPADVLRKSVLHPGIDPRYFSRDLMDLLKSRKSGSFHNFTEAAIKRAFRKLGIHT